MKNWKKIMKINFGRHVIKIKRFFVCSVFNYLKTNATSVVRSGRFWPKIDWWTCYTYPFIKPNCDRGIYTTYIAHVYNINVCTINVYKCSLSSTIYFAVPTLMIWNKELQKSKMGVNVFKLSCTESCGEFLFWSF